MLLENIKRTAERLTGLAQPSAAIAQSLVRDRKANGFHFFDDGLTPNHPRWPLLHYRGVVKLEVRFDPAAIFEVLFDAHGWRDGWRDGIYDFLHYHSFAHEVLGIARGNARVRFGGARGRNLDIKAGDVIVQPAGTGHQRISASRNFLVVGAYPAGSSYDELRAPPNRTTTAPCARSQKRALRAPTLSMATRAR